ncbi:MAG: GFA family protein [Pseudomonadales bacterium]|nr:GFA family protein [Pseudomonadales bacterium]
MNSTSDGECLCGAIRFTATLPTKWVAHCHCTRCQRAHGAAFVTWVGMDEERVVIDDPAGLLRWFSVENGGDRAFCGACGSSMFFKAARWAGELHIARTLFVDPIDRYPQMHAYYDTHVDWVSVTDDLVRKSDPDL